jgi:hypothetical protein
MTPAQPPAERPGVVRRCGKPGRAGGQHPGRAGEQCEGAGASYRGPGQQQPRDGDRGGGPSSQHSPQPGRGARAAAGYSAACQAPQATGPAGITLASPVEAITTPDTVRQGSDTPAADSSRRCAAAPPASDATSAATATPSQDTRSPPACANAARTSLAESIPGLLRSAVSSAPEASGHRGERLSPGSGDVAASSLGRQARAGGHGPRDVPQPHDLGRVATGKSSPGHHPDGHRRGRTPLMVVPPDTVTGPGSRGQAGESPGSGDGRSPAWSQDCKGDLGVKRRRGIQVSRVSKGTECDRHG